MDAVPPSPDPRPLVSEPLALDLANTAWPDADGWHDLLDDRAQRTAWLKRWGLPAGEGPAVVDNLKAGREAIRAALDDRGSPEAAVALNRILAAGRLRLELIGTGPHAKPEVPDPWAATWHAARNLLDLLAQRPERLKHCAGEGCVLWFQDTTKSGTRRWCSMAGCGNRMKARRHYDRQRSATAEGHGVAT